MTPSTISLLMILMLAGCTKAHTDAAIPPSRTVDFSDLDARVAKSQADAGKAQAILNKQERELREQIGAAEIAASTEPPPACHHCPVPPPKIEKHRRRKKPRWTTEYWDLDTQQMVVSHEAPGCIKHGLCVENADGTLSSTGGAYIAYPPHPAMTPQQFTDFMNDALPAAPARKYPPDYKMPKGDQP